MTNHYMVTRAQCPACRGAQLRSLYRCAFLDDPLRGYLEKFYAPQGGVEFKYLDGAEYHLAECLACGLVYQQDVLDDERMLKLYEHWIDPGLAYQRHLKDFGIPMYAQYAQEVMAIVTFLGKIPSTVDILDFGMGWGRWARMSKAFGCNAWGAELSPSRIEYASRHGIEALSWDEIPKRAFDLINTDQVFEHIPDPLDTLQHLIRSLKPGGLVKLSVPDGTDIHRRLKRMDWNAPIGSRYALNAVAPLEHINCFTRSSLITMARKVGLEPVKIPMSIQYRCTTFWTGRKRILKNLLLPIFYNVMGRGTRLFFRRTA